MKHGLLERRTAGGKRIVRETVPNQPLRIPNPAGLAPDDQLDRREGGKHRHVERGVGDHLGNPLHRAQLRDARQDDGGPAVIIYG